MEPKNRIGKKLAALAIIVLLLGVVAPANNHGGVSAQEPGGGGIATPFDGSPSTGIATAGGIIALSHPPDKYLAEVLWDGADNLVSEQNPDGRWSWPNKAAGSPASNIGGPTGEGLLGAYRLTQEQAHVDSAILAGDFMKAQSVLSTHDALFLINLSAATGNPSYQQAALDIYFTPLENGTYVRLGVTYNTTTYINLVRSVRAAYPQYLAWDFSATCIAATQLGTADAELFCDAVREGLDALDPSDWYHTIAVAGGIWGLASIGDIGFTTTSGAYPGYTLTDLADLLASWQTTQGYFPYDPLDSTEDTQETAYAVLALNAMGGYDGEVLAAVLWLMGQQGADGKWPACTGCGNYTEVDGESTWACSLLAPSEVTVDDDWTGMVVGTPLGGGTFGINRLPTIQDGVDGVTASTVHVGPGVYDEQVVIDQSLTLEGEGDSTVVKPSSAAVLTQHLPISWAGGTKQVSGIIMADGVSDVTVKDLKVDGEGVTTKPTGADWVAGVFYRETGGVIDNVTATTMTVGTTGTGVRGYGIYLYAEGASPVFVEVKNSRISNYDKNGLNAQGYRLTTSIHNNEVVGRGPLPNGDEVQNGVVVIADATAIVNNNAVSGNAYLPGTWGAAGILFCNASGSATGNTSTNNQYGPSASILPGFGGTNQTVIFDGNTVSAIGLTGIPIVSGLHAESYVDGATLTITMADNNLAGGGPGNGVSVGDVEGNDPAGEIVFTVRNNTITGWEETGINLVSSVAPGSIITGNTIINNGTDGILISQNNLASPRIGGQNCDDANIFRGQANAIRLDNWSQDVDARFNDWGVYSVSAIEDTIWHDPDNEALGRVFFEPYCLTWGPPASIEITQPLSGTEVCQNQAVTVTVQLLDGAGNPVQGHWVGVYASSGSLESLGGLAIVEVPEEVQTALAEIGVSGTPVGYSCQTGADGTCSVSWTPDELGAAWLLATAGEIFTDPLAGTVKICGGDVYLPIILKNHDH